MSCMGHPVYGSSALTGTFPYSRIRIRSGAVWRGFSRGRDSGPCLTPRNPRNRPQQLDGRAIPQRARCATGIDLGNHRQQLRPGRMQAGFEYLEFGEQLLITRLPPWHRRQTPMLDRGTDKNRFGCTHRIQRKYTYAGHDIGLTPMGWKDRHGHRCSQGLSRCWLVRRTK